MAFGAKQIFPNDTRARVAIGVNLPLNGRAVFDSNYQTKDAIKANLINYFLTNPGERPGNPKFGGGLRAFIFEQITNGNLEYLKEDVSNKIKIKFPNVEVVELNVLAATDNNEVTIQLYYRVTNTSIEDELVLNFT